MRGESIVLPLAFLRRCGLFLCLLFVQGASAQTNLPVLGIAASNKIVTVFWPLAAYYSVLQTATNLSASTQWTDFRTAAKVISPASFPDYAPATINTAQSRITAALASTNGQKFFRLRSASIPVFSFGVFYNGLLEFSACPTFTLNGAVHANGAIYVGAGGSSTLTFNNSVTTTRTVSAPDNNGASWASNNWRTTFNDNPANSTNVSGLNIANMTNYHALIDIPPSGESPPSALGRERMYNKAHVILTITNKSITAKIQASVNGEVPGNDSVGITWSVTNTVASVSSNFPFLSLTNTFIDQRENKKIFVTQIDIKKYGLWIATNASVVAKFPGGSGTYPTILYVADNRTINSTQLTAVRITNSLTLPDNGGYGFTLATPNPLYVWGNYNCTNASYLGTTNTSATMPSALISDALTILSSAWQDSESADDYSDRSAADTTVNAAIMTGSMPSTGSDNLTYSGGVVNLPRLLESWFFRTLALNTSLVRPYDSTRATNQFRNPGNFGLPNSPYYDPPTRLYNFDLNFFDPNKLPPGTPAVSISP